jgi:hypothetical protein
VFLLLTGQQELTDVRPPAGGRPQSPHGGTP